MALFGRSKPEPTTGQPEATQVPDPGPVVAERSLAEQQAHLIGTLKALPPFGIALPEALGLTLCEDISADLDLPLLTSASVAGWAVRSSNLVGATAQQPVELAAVGQIDTEGFRGDPLTPGTTVHVAQGAPVPEGTDAVVPDAQAQPNGSEVLFTTEATFRQNLLLAGSRVADGDVVLDSGTVLNPRSLALLAELGLDKVLARPKPRVVVATVAGSRVDPGLALSLPSQSYDATTTLVAASARADGAQVFQLGLLAVDSATVARTVADQLVRADLVVLATDAVDVVAAAIAELGSVDRAQLDFDPVNQALIGRLGSDGVPLIVVPESPVAACVAYQAFVRPAVKVLAGGEASPISAVMPVLAPLTVDPEVTTAVPGKFTDRGVVPLISAEPIGAVELASADALVIVEPGGPAELPGHSDVTCWFLES